MHWDFLRCKESLCKHGYNADECNNDKMKIACLTIERERDYRESHALDKMIIAL